MFFLGITVQWDGSMRVYLSLDPRFSGKVCGLCGNFDGLADNDFTARSGQIESAAVSFANSWRTRETCPMTADPNSPCTASPEREYWATYACEILRSSAFDECHSVVGVDSYYGDCIWDSCGCTRGGDCECLCTAVSAYVRACNEKGIHIRWRSETVCRKS